MDCLYACNHEDRALWREQATKSIREGAPPGLTYLTDYAQHVNVIENKRRGGPKRLNSPTTI